MPQISAEFLGSIVNLIGSDETLAGTAFIVRYGGIENTFTEAHYLVTCEHCAEVPGKARFANGRTKLVNPTDWSFSPTGADVAALDITEQFEREGDKLGYIDIGLAVEGRDAIADIGSEIYMMGVLLDEKDVGFNVPRARFGNVSAFADEKIPLEQGNRKYGPCHLGDMRSRTGFSGSPVIVYVDITGLNSRIDTKSKLLGIHSGQTWETINLAGKSFVKAVNVPSSITRIVPATAIVDLLKNDPALATKRAARQQ